MSANQETWTHLSPRQLLLRVSLSAGPLAGPPACSGLRQSGKGSPAGCAASCAARGCGFVPPKTSLYRNYRHPYIESAPEGWKGEGGEDGLDLP
jgi:hypothetical protein